MERKSLSPQGIAALEKANQYLSLGTKHLFKSILEGIIKNNYSSIDEYFAALRNVGFKVHRYSNKETGQLLGYSIEMKGVKWMHRKLAEILR